MDLEENIICHGIDDPAIHPRGLRLTNGDVVHRRLLIKSTQFC